MARKKRPPPPEPGLTRGEYANGWTETSLQRYLSERDESINSVLGLGAHTGRGPERVRVINAGNYDPWESR